MSEFARNATYNLLHGAKRGLLPTEEQQLFRALVAQRTIVIRLEKLRSRSPAQQTDLRQARERHLALRNQIVESNLPLAVSVARRCRARNVDFEDLVSIALEKMLLLVDSFDPERGYRFSTYACTAMFRALSRAGQTEMKKWGAKCQGEPTDDVLAREDAGSEVRDLIQGALETASLDDLEAFIIRMRFGLGDAEPKSLEELGLIVGLGKERVRQIQERALVKLRGVLRS